MDIKEKLFGIWSLKALVDIDRGGNEMPRSYKVLGRLIYAAPEDVFVALGYYKNVGYSSNFYTGKFQIDEYDSMIRHHVIISSNTERNGKTLERRFHIVNSQLTLRGENNTGSSVKLIWEREC